MLQSYIPKIVQSRIHLSIFFPPIDPEKSRQPKQFRIFDKAIGIEPNMHEKNYVEYLKNHLYLYYFFYFSLPDI